MASSSATAEATSSFESKVILEVSLQVSQKNEINLATCASPERFRLVNCAALTSKTNPTLRIIEYCNFEFSRRKGPAYTAISYIWKGRPVHGSTQNPTSIVVKGAEDGDPVSLDVLQSACAAASDYLWLDRLCIMQTESRDKSWQIKRMFDIYRLSSSTLILPGGLMKLAHLDEETDWILRAWTLQEAIVPDHALMLFSMEGLKIPTGTTLVSLRGGTEPIVSHSIVTFVGHGLSATVSFKEFLWAIRSCSGRIKMAFIPSETTHPIHVRILGDYQSRIREINALTDAQETPWYGSNLSRHALWQSSFFRTSKRPVDMVFSIMGLFGISLNPNEFHPDDRIRATIALAKEFLSRGNTAEWLIAGWNEPPDPRLSSFPELPDTSIAAPPRFATHKTDLTWEPDKPDRDIRFRFFNQQAPAGWMDDEGYLHYKGQVARVVKQSNLSLITADNEKHDQTITALDGGVWDLCLNNSQMVSDGNEEQHVRKWYASVLGTTRRGSGVSHAKTVVLEQHGTGKFHRLAVFFNLDPAIVKDWPEMSVTMGPVK